MLEPALARCCHGRGCTAAVLVPGGQRAHALVTAFLHCQALEELRLTAEERELAADWIAEAGHATTLLKEIPEVIPVDAVASLVKEAWITRGRGLSTGRRQHPVDRVGDHHAIGFVR